MARGLMIAFSFMTATCSVSGIGGDCHPYPPQKNPCQSGNASGGISTSVLELPPENATRTKCTELCSSQIGAGCCQWLEGSKQCTFTRQGRASPSTSYTTECHVVSIGTVVCGPFNTTSTRIRKCQYSMGPRGFRVQSQADLTMNGCSEYCKRAAPSLANSKVCCEYSTSRRACTVSAGIVATSASVATDCVEADAIVPSFSWAAFARMAPWNGGMDEPSLALMRRKSIEAAGVPDRQSSLVPTDWRLVGMVSLIIGLAWKGVHRSQSDSQMSRRIRGAENAEKRSAPLPIITNSCGTE